MKLNSNTFTLEGESYKELENIIKKIASENEIKDVMGVDIKLSKDEGLIRFVIAESTGGAEVCFNILRSIDLEDIDSLDKKQLRNWLQPTLDAWAGKMSIEDFIRASEFYLKDGSAEMKIIEKIKEILESKPEKTTETEESLMSEGPIEEIGEEDLFEETIPE